ncbi:MAG TPA: S8 family serine peptidase [Chitinophagaceae bacterium]|nr:S8 family serine peptidase [Chitinophagaceae bacterium]
MPLKIKSTKKAAAKAKQVHNLFATHDDRPRFTGKRIVIMNRDARRSSILKLSKNASLKIASINDFSTDKDNFQEAFSQADGIYFDTFKIAVINKGNEEQVKFMHDASAGTTDSFSSEPERFVYALARTQPIAASKDSPLVKLRNSSHFTWGTQAIKLPASKFTGKGVNVAVLDTGLSLSHPDFARLVINSKSFIKNQRVEDKNGHGTHCCGISVGAINKKSQQRYGVAMDANLFVGKVLSNAGSGNDSGILAGIEWALQNKCKVISMSLGAEVEPGETFSPAYERVAKTAIKNGCLIIAAAGNESERRFGVIKPVGHPANCPSVMAVAAIDINLKVADFSCGGLNPDGGQVDIAAPGVNIYSSWKGRAHNTISGTSMATPFVAGIAALFWEANPNAKAADIWMMLMQNALRLNINSSDVGQGLYNVNRYFFVTYA